MPLDQPHPRTYLFTLRLWIEPVGDNQGEVRIQVQHLLSGETRYFRAWSDVVAFLLTKLRALNAANRGEGGDDS